MRIKLQKTVIPTFTVLTVIVRPVQTPAPDASVGRAPH